MILVDTSVWIDHLGHGDSTLSDQLERGQVLVHPFVIGELAMGNLRNRSAVLGSLQDLPRVTVANHEFLIRSCRGWALAISMQHLLASVRLTADSAAVDAGQTPTGGGGPASDAGGVVIQIYVHDTGTYYF
ncbi:MAG TPA: hypothetical protein VNW54_15005 [Granulicella sp.]|jgi:hypothetical protein|nr:hypothetical protein [Granulicella sp.]